MNIPELAMVATTSRVQFWRFHHVGYVVASIRTVAERFARSVGTSWDQTIIYDPMQAVRVTFIGNNRSSSSLLELVEPVGQDSPVLGFLKRGGGLHHVCYEVSHLEQQLGLSQSMGGRIVRPPLPASAFEGRRIAWVFTRDRLLVELLETSPHTDRLDGHARLETEIQKDEWRESGHDKV